MSYLIQLHWVQIICQTEITYNLKLTDSIIFICYQQTSLFELLYYLLMIKR